MIFGLLLLIPLLLAVLLCLPCSVLLYWVHLRRVRSISGHQQSQLTSSTTAREVVRQDGERIWHEQPAAPAPLLGAASAAAADSRSSTQLQQSGSNSVGGDSSNSGERVFQPPSPMVPGITTGAAGATIRSWPLPRSRWWQLLLSGHAARRHHRRRTLTNTRLEASQNSESQHSIIIRVASVAPLPTAAAAADETLAAQLPTSPYSDGLVRAEQAHETLGGSSFSSGSKDYDGGSAADGPGMFTPQPPHPALRPLQRRGSSSASANRKMLVVQQPDGVVEVGQLTRS